MSEVLRGSLVGAESPDFTGYRVTATFQTKADVGKNGHDADAADEVWLDAASSVLTGKDGSFEVALPADGTWRGPLRASASAPTGLVLVTRDVKDPLPDRVELDVGAVAPPTVEPSSDPRLGARRRLTGRVLDAQGTGVRDGLVVVLWGVPKGGAQADAFPAVVAVTAAGGYFSEDWPAVQLDRAFGIVAGGEPIPVPLEKERLPQNVVLVVTGELPEPPPAHDDDDCECAPAPPRAPDQADLTAAGDLFSGDLGGRCVDLTVPNRAVEEVTFHAVVRTSEPAIKGLTFEEPSFLPPSLAGRLSELVLARRYLQAAEPEPKVAVLRAAPAAGEAEAPSGEPATGMLAFRSKSSRTALTLDPRVLTDLARDPDALTADRLLSIEHASLFERIRDVVKFLGSAVPGRVTLDGDHVVDWDDTPTTYQATTIAHGHLLAFKQVWRADGYSLGDLLYSLPLAPGQKKNIAVLDWDRRETAARIAERRSTEQVAADLVHDRDIAEILDTSLRESSRGHSESNVGSVGGALGGFIGPVVFGVAGGYSTSSASAWQNSARDVAGTSLSQMRDRTMQAASSVRSQRATVVQTARQGESLRVQTEVVANHNHCHAVTVEYFEVLRHFQVSHELAGVQECLFVPFALTPFSSEKALRWREPLELHLRRPDLAGGFDALERVRTNWADADYPANRYADDPLTYLDGDLWISFSLPRPADDADHKFDAAQWGVYVGTAAEPGLLPDAQAFWNNYLGVAMPADRDRIWDERLAPRLAERLVARIQVQFRLDDGTVTPALELDTTLVSSFAQERSLLVSLRPGLATMNVPRARIKSVIVTVPVKLPADAKVVVLSGSMRYRTDHLSHALFDDYLILNDLGESDDAEVTTPLDRAEKRNPRREDLRLGASTVNHLNEHVEYYHQAIWLSLDPNRRYLLLDGFVAPNAGGRSVASVVENRLIGIVGNCLVMPVVPGVQLDPGYKADGVDLRHAYATDAPPPIRLSVPTRGVFAEAVMGACNSCELIDDTRFWRWEESPIPDDPTAIQQVSTGTRRTAPPGLAPDEFPQPLVRMQTAPRAPDPTGLAAALGLIGTPNLFKDITGLDLTQKNAAEAFKSALDTAKFFGSEAGKLAQQQFLNGEMDRTLKRIKDARDKKLITDEQARQLTNSALQGASGERRPSEQKPTSTPAVQRALDRAAKSESSSVKVTRPNGTVEVTSGDQSRAGAVDFSVDPPVVPIAQPSNLVCWAAAGAMLLSWKSGQMTIEQAADRAGAPWRAKLDQNQALKLNEIDAYRKAIGLDREFPMCYLPRGILRLLQEHGPLWVIGDDAVPDDKMSHVRIVTGIRGDGTDGGTFVRLVDPDGGKTVEEPYNTFTTRMEADDPANLNVGIFHW